MVSPDPTHTPMSCARMHSQGLPSLAAGSDGGFLFDLLTPGAPPVSIKDSRAQQAMDAATLFALDGPADISEVLRVGQVAQTLAAEATRPAGGYR